MYDCTTLPFYGLLKRKSQQNKSYQIVPNDLVLELKYRTRIGHLGDYKLLESKLCTYS